MVWMISANGKMYDHASSFATFGYVDWRQRANYQIGDIVFIYCTKPLRKVMYKCQVIKCDMSFSECVDDRRFWKNIDEYQKSQVGRYARLKLLAQVNSELLNLYCLRENGLSSAPQGPIKVSAALCRYIDQHFNDYYTQGVFNDVDEQQQYHEGHVVEVKVNRYERSSIARMKCIEYHGIKCVICGLDFGERYGTLGEGFIHVHHLKPLHAIGEDYVVDYQNDLIPVCPNCHAMIHRINQAEVLSVKELREILK